MKTYAILIAGTLLAVSASAQTVKSNTGVYLGIEGGIANNQSLDSPSGYRTTSETRNAGLFRVMLGYQFTPNWALEAGYFSSGDFKQNGTNGSSDYEASYKTQGGDLSAVYKFTEGLPGLFLKAGLSYAEASGSVTPARGTVRGSRDISLSSGGYLVGLGYEFDFTKNWGANVAYTRMQRVGASDVNLNLVSAGIKYHF